VFHLTAFMPQIASNGTRPFDLGIPSENRPDRYSDLFCFVAFFYDPRLRCF